MITTQPSSDLLGTVPLFQPCHHHGPQTRMRGQPTLFRTLQRLVGMPLRDNGPIPCQATTTGHLTADRRGRTAQQPRDHGLPVTGSGKILDAAPVREPQPARRTLRLALIRSFPGKHAASLDQPLPTRPLRHTRRRRRLRHAQPSPQTIPEPLTDLLTQPAPNRPPRSPPHPTPLSPQVLQRPLEPTAELSEPQVVRRAFGMGCGRWSGGELHASVSAIASKTRKVLNSFQPAWGSGQLESLAATVPVRRFT